MKKCLLVLSLSLLFIIPSNAQTFSEALNNHDTVTALKLINAGYKLDSLDSYGSSVLMSACRYTDDTTSANFLLNHGAKADFPRSPKGRTALIISCAYYAGVPLCRVLLNHGADINAVTVNGETALMFAAKNAKSDVVAYLLKNGANAKLKDKSGNTALEYAKSASIDETLVKAMKCCLVDKEKTIALLTEALSN